MKMYRVVGFRKASGEYEGHKYSNYYLHCVSLDDSGDNFEGQRVKSEMKVKEKIGYVPAVGDEIQVTYGEFGIENVERVF